jgi:hypothetical protein
MKKIWMYVLAATVACTQMTACKDKKKDADSSTTQLDSSYSTAPVEISTDDQLKRGLADATKDFPGVNATASNGEVTLTGTIDRDRLPRLMQAVQALQPKKVNNNLTVKP